MQGKVALLFYFNNYLFQTKTFQNSPLVFVLKQIIVFFRYYGFCFAFTIIRLENITYFTQTLIRINLYFISTIVLWAIVK